MSGIKREFNLVTEYVETLASKDYPLIVHKFFNEMMTLINIDREETIQRAFDFSDKILKILKEEQDSYENKRKKLDCNEENLAFNTLNQLYISNSTSSRDDNNTRDTYEFSTLLKLLTCLCKNIAIDSFFMKLDQSVCISVVSDMKKKIKKDSSSRLVEFKSIYCSCSLYHYDFTVVLPNDYSKNKQFIFNTFFQHETKLWVLKFSLCKIREFITSCFGGKDIGWHHSLEFPDHEVICVSFLPVYRDDMEPENFFKSKSPRKFEGFHFKIDNKEFDIFFDTIKGFKNRLILTNFKPEEKIYIRFACKKQFLSQNTCQFDYTEYKFFLDKRENLLKWILDSNINAWCFVNLIFYEFMLEFYDDFDGCWDALRFILNSYAHFFKFQHYLLLFAACNRWLSSGNDITKIFSIPTWKYNFTIDNYKKTDYNNNSLIFELIFNQFLTKTKTSEQLVVKTKLLFLKKSIFDHEFLRNGITSSFDFSEMIENETNIDLIIRLFDFFNSFVKSNRETYLKKLISSNKFFEKFISAAEGILSRKRLIISDSKKIKFAVDLINDYFLKFEFELFSTWEHNIDLRDRTLLIMIRLLLKRWSFERSGIETFYNILFEEGGMPRRIYNKIFNSYSKINPPTLFTLFSLIKNFLAANVVISEKFATLLLLLAKQIFILNMRIIENDLITSTISQILDLIRLY